MNWLKRHWYFFLLVPLMGVMGMNIVNMVVRDAPTLPRPVDVSQAERSLAPEAGVDTREALPPARTVGGIGVVEPRDRETQVSASVAGRVVKVLVEEGVRVTAGDALVELERDVEEAAALAAKAEVATAEARLASLAKGSRYEDIRAAKADADAARARAALSAGIYDRTKALFAASGTSADDLDRAKRQADADRAAAQAADARRLATVNGNRPEEVEVAAAELAAAKARLAQAEVALERLTIRAPLSSEVLQVKVRAGEWAQPGTALATLGDTSELRARLDIDERDIGAVAIGTQATVRVNAYPGTDFRGTVTTIGRRMGRRNVRSDDPTERNDTKILEVVVLLDASAQGKLVVGQRVTGFIGLGAPR